MNEFYLSVTLEQRTGKTAVSSFYIASAMASWPVWRFIMPGHSLLTEL